MLEGGTEELSVAMGNTQCKRTGAHQQYQMCHHQLQQHTHFHRQEYHHNTAEADGTSYTAGPIHTCCSCGERRLQDKPRWHMGRHVNANLP